MKEVYQVLSGALGQEMRLTQIANNLANVNTVGFKKDSAVFQDCFKASLDKAGKLPAGTVVPQEGNPANPSYSVWPALGQPYTDMREGTLQPTGQPLDVAIEGDGFFQVEAPAGTSGSFVTRAGNFRVSDKGELVTADGRRVLDTGGSPIKIDLRDGTPEITAEGNITINGASVGQLGVMRFDDAQKLEKFGESLLHAPQGLAAQKIDRPSLRQGMLEGSNVNPIDEMVKMIEVERAYQTHQKVISAIDELTSKRIEATR